MEYHFDFSVIWHNWKLLVSGFYFAGLVTGASLLLSLPIAVIIALCRLSKRPFLKLPAAGYVAVFRNTPTLVQLIWVYYCLPILFGIDFGAAEACIFALTLGAGAYMGEVARAGIQSIDAGQLEAARTVGLSYFQAMRRVVFPQAFRRMIPPTVNEIVTLIKHSSLVSVLGVADLTYQAQVLSSNTFRPIEIFTFLGFEYLLICSTVSHIARRIELKLGVSGAR
jgi:His/Glu/Gln/Arg/opine family amino acid ABC transporter permease subunit